MKIILNILWFIFIGFWACIGAFLLGALLCITIVGIPFGKQLFKIASLYGAPFGKTVTLNPGRHIVLNVIWVIIVGFATTVGNFIMGCILCITIIGIPLGKQLFKIAKIWLFPFGAEISG